MTLKTKHFGRYKDVVRLLVKYGRDDLVKEGGLDEGVPAGAEAPPVPAKAEELADDLEKMGSTFIKLGQLLSTRADFLPPAYMDGLTRLQDKVEPFPVEEVEAILNVELGVRLSKAFREFDREPMAAASLGQVHRAVLRNGREVAVKVQRPHIRERIVEDLAALDEIAEFLDAKTEIGRKYEFGKMMEEFRKSLLSELDYRQEAQNLRTMRERLHPFERIVVPAPVDDYSTSRVLTMDYIPGTKITSMSPLVRLDIDGAVLAEQLFQAYLQQILVDGFFHADPHPGNVFLTPDHRIALIDLGMVARLGARMQEQLLQLLLAISEGHSDEAAEIAIKIGEQREGFDRIAFSRRISDFVGRAKDANIQQLQVGKVVLELTQASAENGMRVPQELAMLGKTLLNLDIIGRTLDPSFDPNASIRRNAAEILRQRLLKSVSPGNLATGLLEVKDLLQRLPGRVNKLIDAVANNDLRIKVDAIDEDVLIDGMQKVANRITVGLILAALIVGAALLMRVETNFRIMGYPGLAILCFLGAAAGGVMLIIEIMAHDRRKRKK